MVKSQTSVINDRTFPIFQEINRIYELLMLLKTGRNIYFFLDCETDAELPVESKSCNLNKVHCVVK